MSKGQDIVPVSNYRIASMNPDKLASLMEDNLGGGGGFWEMHQRITVPTGGGSFWEVNGEAVQSVRGIIIHQRNVRRYYKKGLDQGGEQSFPDCQSWDMEVGIGDPGIVCNTCALNEWGSAPPRGGQESRGKACKSYTMLVIQLPDKVMPYLCMVPPTSLKQMRRFLVSLVSEGHAYHEIVTELGLIKEKKSGTDTAVIVPRIGEVIPPEMHERSVQPLVSIYKERIGEEVRRARQEYESSN